MSNQSSPSLSSFVLLFFLVLRSCLVHRSFFGRSVWWQRGLLGISFAVVYFLFVSLINFSPCQIANCVLFVSGGVVGEFAPFGQARVQRD